MVLRPGDTMRPIEYGHLSSGGHLRVVARFRPTIRGSGGSNLALASKSQPEIPPRLGRF
jgi:hypothetical protein